MAADLSPSPPREGRRWVRWLLVASLALNLMFIGLAVGAAMRFGGPDRHGPPSVGSALYRAMPSEDRAEIRAEMRAMREARRGDSVKAEAGAIAAALQATPFDPEALESLVEAQMSRQEAWFRGTQDAWLARVAAMTPEARSDYAKRLLDAVENRSRKRGWFGR